MNIKTWEERWEIRGLHKEDAMQAEIAELRAVLQERDALKTALAERDAELIAKRKVLEQVLDVFIDTTGAISMKRFWRDKDGKRFDEITDEAITAIQGVLK